MATIMLPQKPKYYGREKEKLKARLEDVENKIDILKPKVETALNVFCASLPENDEDSELAEQFMMLEYQLQDLCDERYYLQKEINRQERSKNMKCNYKKHLPIKEKIFTFEDKSHFSPFGSCFILGETYSDFIGHPDGVTLHLDMCNLMLFYTLNHPTKEEISNFQQGELKFALAEDNNILFLLNKFGSTPWGSSNQNYSLNTSVYQLDDNANMMSLLLFDSSNGKLVAMRTIGLHWHFLKALNDGIRKQLSTPYSIEEFSRLVKSTYRKYPTDLDLLKDAYYFYDFQDKETNEMLDKKLKR